MKTLSAFIRIVAEKAGSYSSIQGRMTSGFLYETHPWNKTRHDPRV